MTGVVRIITDDQSKFMLRCHAVLAFAQPLTPMRSFMAAHGMTFEQYYGSSWCSSSRFQSHSGRYGHRTGAGELLGSADPLPSMDEVLTPKVLRNATNNAIKCGLFGKWHCGNATSVGGASSPNQRGWNQFKGNLENTGNHWDWARVVNGVANTEPTYHATKIVDDALVWWTNVWRHNDWFMTAAFMLPHVPLHVPTEGLYQSTFADPENPTDYEMVRAMTEALDCEVFRLLHGIGFVAGEYPNNITCGESFGSITVVWDDDNGTAFRSFPPLPLFDKHGLEIKPGHSKKSVYQVGCNLSLIVAGEMVGCAPGSVSHELVSGVDLWATIAEFFNVDALDQVDGNGLVYDSVSFAGVLEGGTGAREDVLIEDFTPNNPHQGTAFGFYGIVGQRDNGHQYKVIRNISAEKGITHEFYDVWEGDVGYYCDPQECTNLVADDAPPLSVEQQTAYDQLIASMDAQFAS